MKTYEFKDTKHPDLFRVVDRDGNWQHYYLKSKDVYLRGVTTILDRAYAKGAGFNEWLLRITPAERDEILKSTGDKGDMVHRAIDVMLSVDLPISSLEREEGVFNRITNDYRKLSNSEWDALLSFAQFWIAHEPVLIASEVPLFNVAEGYAGTSDALLMIKKSCEGRYCKCKDYIGKIGVWDWKTGSGIRASYSAQLGAYRNAENIKDHLPAKAKVSYTAVLRIGTRHKNGGYETAFYGDNDGYARFLSAKQIDDYEYVPFNPSEEIREIPDAISIKVSKLTKVAAKTKKQTNGKGKRNSEGAKNSTEATSVH